MTENIIKTKKQENGLWGIPTTVTYYKGIPKNFENHIIESALLMFLYETGTTPEKVYSFDNDFRVLFGSGNSVNYVYENYMVVDNILYLFYNLKEKKIFLRKFKIKEVYGDM